MFGLVDCNSFYASCEQVFNPALEGRPVVILSNNDGCIVSMTPEAKLLGIQKFSPAFLQEDLFRRHDVAVFSSNYALYGSLSERVMNTLMSTVAEVEVYSIDEAFLSLTGYDLLHPDLHDFGTALRTRVRQWTGIPVGVGIAPTKTLAKVANKLAKQQGGVCVMQDYSQIVDVLREYPVAELWGIGRQYVRKLEEFGIGTALQLAEANDAWLKKHFTVQGLRLAMELRGVPCRHIETVPASKQAVCTARSFGHLTKDIDIVAEALANHTANVARKLRRQQSAAVWLTVFLNTNRYRMQDEQYNACRTLTLPVATNLTPELLRFSRQALADIWREGYLYKKVGCVATGLVPQDQVQKDLFYREPDDRVKCLMAVMDRYNDRNGRDAIRLAAQGYDRKWKLRQEKLSPRYTTRWEDILQVKC